MSSESSNGSNGSGDLGTLVLEGQTGIKRTSIVSSCPAK